MKLEPSNSFLILDGLGHVDRANHQPPPSYLLRLPLRYLLLHRLVHVVRVLLVDNRRRRLCLALHGAVGTLPPPLPWPDLGGGRLTPPPMPSAGWRSRRGAPLPTSFFSTRLRVSEEWWVSAFLRPPSSPFLFAARSDAVLAPFFSMAQTQYRRGAC